MSCLVRVVLTHTKIHCALSVMVSPIRVFYVRNKAFRYCGLVCFTPVYMQLQKIGSKQEANRYPCQVVSKSLRRKEDFTSSQSKVLEISPLICVSSDLLFFSGIEEQLQFGTLLPIIT